MHVLPRVAWCLKSEQIGLVATYVAEEGKAIHPVWIVLPLAITTFATQLEWPA